MANVKPKVLIIGAGPSGLVTLRYVKEVADVTCFDAKDTPGGLWVYTDVTELNHPDLENDVYYKHSGHLHSSMYKNITCNSPSPLMTFKDFPQEEDTPIILEREHFFDYLLRYTKHFDLFKHLKLSTFVLSVRLTAGLTDEEKREWAVEGKRKFAVKYCSATDESQVGYQEFDYVIVCNGHHSYPWIPKIEGDDEFQGDKLPLHCYRDVNIPSFKGKDILIIGPGITGLDLIVQLLYNPCIGQDYIGKLYLAGPTEMAEKSTDFKEMYEKGKVILKRGHVQRMGKNDVTFADGTKAKVDTICYGCGYRFWFPFLENNDKLVDWSLDVHEGKYFGPLFARMFAIREPDLMFVGSHDSPALQTIIERQAIVAKRHVEGQVELPSQEEMYTSLERDLEEYKKLNAPMKKYFFLFFNPEDYRYEDQFFEQLRGLAKMETDPVVYETLKELAKAAVKQIGQGNNLSYRTHDYKTLVPEGFNDTSKFF